MVYTNNVPQANQQISSTQAPILANFAFLQTALTVDHNFDAGGAGSDMYHLKASMPNLAGPETKPSGTNGMYYVLNGDAQFLADDGVKCLLTKGVAATEGYQWIGRVLVQWGFKSTSVGSASSEAFAIPFPTNVFMVMGTLGRVTDPDNTSGINATLVVSTNSGGTTYKTNFKYAISGTSSVHIDGFFWLAIGN